MVIFDHFHEKISAHLPLPFLPKFAKFGLKINEPFEKSAISAPLVQRVALLSFIRSPFLGVGR